MYSEKYHSKPGYRYFKTRDYQVLDAQGYYIQRVMSVDETLEVWQNPCNFLLVDQDLSTQPNGTFRDRFYLMDPTPACEDGASCVTNAYQDFKIDGVPVQPTFTVTWTCSDVTVR
jgi:hypothetical protein